jgi:hypothetical protein
MTAHRMIMGKRRKKIEDRFGFSERAVLESSRDNHDPSTRVLAHSRLRRHNAVLVHVRGGIRIVSGQEGALWESRIFPCTPGISRNGSLNEWQSSG